MSTHETNMPISFQCGCGKALKARDELAGRAVKCPECGEGLTVPTPEPIAEDETYGLSDPIPRPQAPVDPARWAFKPPATTAPTPPPKPSTPTPRPQRPVPVPEEPSSSPREYLYVLLALALIPLGFSLLRDHADGEARFERAIERLSPQAKAELAAKSEGGGLDLDGLIAAMPGGRLDDDAHLPRETVRHYIYAGVSAFVFWGFLLAMFARESARPGHLLLVGLFTATLGIVFLLGVQYVAAATQGVWLRGRSPLLILFYIVKFIGFSYAAAEDPGTGFPLSFLGFTFGVGLCEELCKALPLVVYYRRNPRMGWRAACLWGLASGAGFGVSEGIMYSARSYNGVATSGIYVVRFVSCVALHALWTATVAITVQRKQDQIQGNVDWVAYSLAILSMLLVPMVLHGAYDTLLKKDMNLYALITGAATFAWFAWTVEGARGAEG